LNISGLNIERREFNMKIVVGLAIHIHNYLYKS
jgi:hypothetical protein